MYCILCGIGNLQCTFSINHYLWELKKNKHRLFLKPFFYNKTTNRIFWEICFDLFIDYYLYQQEIFNVFVFVAYKFTHKIWLFV